MRSVRRIPVEKRLGEDSVDWVGWAPWHQHKDARDADGDVPEDVPAEDRRSLGGGGWFWFGLERRPRGISRSPKRMLKNIDTPEGAADAPAGLGDWRGNLTLRLVVRDAVD